MNAPLLDGLPSQKQLDAVFTRVELDLRPTRSRRRVRIAGVGLALAAVLGATGYAAYANVDQPARSPSARAATQLSFEEWADGFYALVSRPFGDDGSRVSMGGNGGLVVDLDRRVVTLSWNGPIPAEVQALIDAPPSGLAMSVKHTDFDLNDAQAAMDLLTRNLDAIELPVGVMVVGVSPSDALDGLDVYYEGDGVTKTNRAAILGTLSAGLAMPVVNLVPGGSVSEETLSFCVGGEAQVAPARACAN